MSTQLTEKKFKICSSRHCILILGKINKRSIHYCSDSLLKIIKFLQFSSINDNYIKDRLLLTNKLL